MRRTYTCVGVELDGLLSLDAAAAAYDFLEKACHGE